MQPFWDWFIGEAGAAWVIGLLGLILGLYSIYLQRSQKTKRGNYIVCRQVSLFSHLHMSERARKLVNVEYTGESQRDPKPISTLSQTIIDIRNESEIDALYNIELEFHVLNARVLSVGWEPPVLGYLVEQSEPSFHPRTGSSSAGEKASGSYWEIRVPLAQLTSYEKYRESFRVGILADGDLSDIRTPEQGNRDNTSPDWRAKFVPFEEYRKEQTKSWQQSTIASVLIFFAILLMMIAGFLWITFWLYGPFVADWRLLVAASLLGFVFAGIFGFVMTRIRLARVKIGSRNRPQSVRYLL